VRRPSVAVIDYGIGNLHSAHKALLCVGADAVLTADPEVIASTDAVVLPGVGNFGACMEAIRSHNLEGPINRAIASGRPFLGICVGMQMLFESSDESPGAPGLGVFAGTVRWLPHSVKRPQMQWNRLAITRPDLVIGSDSSADQWMYFVHSLAAVPVESEIIAATVDYGGDVVAACRRENILATQFHPEKSSVAGLALLERWVLSVRGEQA
jgi:glutamine amidotransferase